MPAGSAGPEPGTSARASAAQGPEGFLAVEEPDVLRLNRREPPHCPGQVHEVRLVRRGVREHPDLVGQMVPLPGITRTARGYHVGPVVTAAPRQRNQVVAREALARLELHLPSLAVLATVVVAGKEEGVRDLTAEAAGNMNELDESYDRRFGQGDARTSDEIEPVRFDDLRLAFDDLRKSIKGRSIFF